MFLKGLFKLLAEIKFKSYRIFKVRMLSTNECEELDL